jgi:hypothetical protein
MNLLYALFFNLPNFTRIGIAGKAINRIPDMTMEQMPEDMIERYNGRKKP